MELLDIPIGKPISSSENHLDTDGSILEIGKEKVNSLKNSIIEIEFAISERESLSKIVIDECDKIKMGIDNFLIKTHSIDAEDFKERTGLRQKQIEVSELQLNEKINCWRDVSLLKKELRELKKELSEKEERLSMFGKILNDSNKKKLKGGND